DFFLMLPKDAKARRQDAITNVKEQSQVDDHFVHVKPEDRPAPFSDALFEDAAIQWLIETDQPVAAFEHHTFQNMIHMASRATRTVNIPKRNQTCDEIIAQFKAQMMKLKELLNVLVFSLCSMYSAH
ncbi:hypothetical protein BC826DRAFT_921438, partial [Russula brevipes]